MDAFLDLELSAVETAGRYWEARSPHLLVWLHAVRPPGAFEAMNGIVVALTRARSGEWEERSHSLSSEEVVQILRQLSALGVPGRDLAVRGVTDTSDVICRLAFQIALNGRQQALDVYLMASGLEGADADEFRQLLRTVYGLVGVADRERSYAL